MSNFHRRIIGGFQRALSRHKAVVSIAVKIGNQCRAIVNASLNDGTDATLNGEALLVNTVAQDSIVAVDVGAHRGEWAKLIFASDVSVEKCVLIEPDIRAVNELRLRFVKNRIAIS